MPHSCQRYHETETQAIDYPIEVITDDNKYYVDEKKWSKQRSKGNNPERVQTIDGVGLVKPTIVSGKVIECHNLEKSVVAAKKL